MAGIPETNEPKVAMLAIAWELVSQVYGGHFRENGHTETVRRVTNEVLRVYTALSTGKSINGVQVHQKLEGAPVEMQRVG
jgi:hypothetical protein